MTQPRTFISSTCFDLADARASLGTFLKSIGHEPVMSDTLAFGVNPAVHSHRACIDEVDRVHFLVLIVGGRRGGTYVASENSITNEEYRRAVSRKIPIYTFVKKEVDSAARLYKKNPTGNFSDVVDHSDIFKFIELVKSQSENNWVHTFETVADIQEALRSQFAHLHVLYSEQHVRERTPAKKKADVALHNRVPFPSDFSALPEGPSSEEGKLYIKDLRAIHTVLKEMEEASQSSYGEKTKVLWVLARHGKVSTSGRLVIPEPQFKDRAWGTFRGDRVFRQLEPFGIDASYQEDEDHRGARTTSVHLRLRKGKLDLSEALKRLVRDLADRFNDDSAALQAFQNRDMRIYSSG